MQTIELLQEFLSQHVENPPDHLTPEQGLAAIGLDSLALLELVFTIEEKFGVKFPDDVQRPTTVGELVELADRLRASLPAVPEPARAAAADPDLVATGVAEAVAETSAGPAAMLAASASVEPVSADQAHV